MKKRLLCALLAAAAAVSVAACAPAAESGGASAGGEQAGQEAPAEGVTEIEFWYGLGGNQAELMEQIISTYNSSQDKVRVIGVQQSSYGDTAKALQAAVAAQSVPATTLCSHPDLRTLYNKGVLEPLNSYIEADAEFDQDDILDSFMDYCLNDAGDIMFLPAWGTTQVVYYRKDLFEEAGIDPEWAFADWLNLAEACRQMTVKEGDEVTFYGFEPMSGSDCLVDMAYSNGADIISEDGKTIVFDSPEFVEALESARQWINEEKIMGIHYGGDGWEYWYQTIDDVMEGRAGGYVGSSGDQADLDFTKIAAHVQPGFNGNPPRPYADPVVVGMLALASDEQKEAGFDWLTYVNKTGTVDFCVSTGYVPARQSVQENETYKTYAEENPQALVILDQVANYARMKFIDPTGGKIDTALGDACDLIELENVPAEEALKEAKEIAQAALDEYWAEQEG